MTTITREQPVSAANEQPVSAGNKQAASAADEQPESAVQALVSADPPATSDDSALLPVSGILDIADGRAFVRTSGYRMGRDDVYVSASQIRQYGLRRGDHIAGAARPAGQGVDDRPGRRTRTAAAAKNPPLARIDTINGLEPERSKARPEFDNLTPLYPQERLRLESGSPSSVARVIDLVSPIGKGQRGLIVSAPKVG